MTTNDATQLSLWGPKYYHAQDQVRYAIEVANAKGIAAALDARPDTCRGTVRISLIVEEMDEVTLRLVQNLALEGWTRNSRGAEWMVTLPPNLFPCKAYTPAHAYALAFKHTLREQMHPEPIRFQIDCKYTG